MTVPIGSGHGITNIEGHEDFDIVWPWNQPGGLRRGATAVLRVKNEAPSMRFVLPPLLRACDHVLLVDNGSDDGTGQAALAAAADAGLSHKFTVKEYPFSVARAGAEHLAVNERSVHSLAYFYNWCFSHVRTRYSWKWDGDMVLTTEGEVSLADLSWQVGMTDAVVRIPRHGLYVKDETTAYLDLGLRNIEEWGFPMSPDFVYSKAPEWEIRTTPETFRMFALPQGLVVELKHLDGDVTEAHATLDELRDAYTDLYEEAEAISKSSVVAARIAGAQAAAADVPPPSGGLTDRIPHDVRAKIPPSVRRGVRKALGRERTQG